MTDLLQRVDAAIATRRLLRPRQKVLVAVSGGLDSMVLLEVLRRLAAGHRWHLTVAHLNHCLRGRSSDADERLVRRICGRHGILCAVNRVDVKRLADEHGQSIEMAARKARHEFLARTAREQSVRTIALAHHADDQVELFFLRLLRGAGPEGLAGMKWTAASPADTNVQMVRPLLGCSKAELLAFARDERIAYREDASNAQPDFLRNRIRHELIPLLATNYQPALAKVVLRNIEILGAEGECLDQLAADWRRGRAKVPFVDLHLALQRRVLVGDLIKLGVVPEFELVERLRNSPGVRVTAAPGRWLSHDGAGHVRLAGPDAGDFSNDETTIELAEGRGRGSFGGLTWRWEISPRAGSQLPRFVSGSEWFDADRVGDSVVLRHWRPGDRFQPSGFPTSAKLQDLFVNAKIPQPMRKQLVVATTGTGEIWWVEGLRIGEQFKLSPRTRRRLKWTWRARRRAEGGMGDGNSGPVRDGRSR